MCKRLLAITNSLFSLRKSCDLVFWIPIAFDVCLVTCLLRTKLVGGTRMTLSFYSNLRYCKFTILCMSCLVYFFLQGGHHFSWTNSPSFCQETGRWRIAGSRKRFQTGQRSLTVDTAQLLFLLFLLSLIYWLIIVDWLLLFCFWLFVVNCCLLLLVVCCCLSLTKHDVSTPNVVNVAPFLTICLIGQSQDHIVIPTLGGHFQVQPVSDGSHLQGLRPPGFPEKRCR